MSKNTDMSETIRNIPRACSHEDAAVAFLEAQRGWADHAACVHCGSENVYKMKGRDGARNKRYLWKCNDCSQQYTVRIGTVFEDSRIALRHWCYAYWAACASKKGVSALQIHRMTGVSYKSALFMMHRIRWAMADTDTVAPLTGTVEIDETYVGGKVRGNPTKKEAAQKRWDTKVPVVAMVQRGGDVRAMVMPRVNAANLRSAIDANVCKSSRLMTDEASYYKTIGKEFQGGHETVVHSNYEYVRGDATTNSVEGFFSLLKRGIFGVFHNVSEEHLHRYVSEAAFKYNSRKLNDGERLTLAIRKSEGKRLMYKDPIER